MAQSMTLGLQHSQNMKQTQRMIMSPQMQQAIHFLQVPIMELSVLVEAEMEQNPVLEYSSEYIVEEDEFRHLEYDPEDSSGENDSRPNKELEFGKQEFEILKQLDEEFRDHFAESGGFQKRSSEDEKLKTFQESSIVSENSLFEHLTEQAFQTFDKEQERHIAETIIGHLDHAGFLHTPLTEIALLINADVDKVADILAKIQTFDPYGIGARSLQESLLIQLACQGHENTLAYKIIRYHYDDLLHNHIRNIQKNLGCTVQEINEAIKKYISKLDLHPGTCYSKEITPYIIPDAEISLEDGRLTVTVNQEYFPALKINSRYMRMMEDENLSKDTKDFIRHKILSAKWLLKNINQRNNTIERITNALAVRQHDFFVNPKGKLTPLIMKTLADELELHESTIARAVSGKYINTPRGMLSLRSFFTHGFVSEEGKELSSKTVQEAMQEIIDQEDKKKPLSDEAISKKLKELGINCARRTVAKYRMELNLGNAQQRKKF